MSSFEPYRLLLLDQLKDVAAGTKVRFLACVHEYEIATGTILLKTQYPAQEANSDVPRAIVNIGAVLENINHELLQIGAWLNVVGYMTKPWHEKRRRSRETKGSCVSWIDATMIWSAGAIQLEKYNDALRQYQKSLPGT